MIARPISIVACGLLAWGGQPHLASAQTSSDAWVSHGPVEGIVNAVAVDPLIPRTLYAGTDQEGLFKSTDGGETWVAVNNGLPGLRVWRLAIDPQLSSTLYATIAGAGIFKSVDGGGTWSAAQTGIPPSVRMSVLALAIDPQTPMTLYAGTNGDSLFKTTDGGASWSRSGPMNTQAIVIDPQNSSTVYAGTDLQLFKSTDGGANWTTLQTGLRASWVSALTIHPQAPKTVYLGTRSYETSPPYRQLLTTIDGGANWTDSTAGLTNGMVRAVAVDFQSPSTVYAGTGFGGVFQSRDTGATWTAMNEGLTNLTVSGLALDAQSAVLYAATDGGVFARSIAPPRFALTVTTSGIGRGGVTSSPDGIACGSVCSEPYLAATGVTLTATPALGSAFTGWRGCDVVSGRRCTVVMTEAKSVDASFVGLPLGIGLRATAATRALGARSK
jgi:photosystem II stability/assembly factor-like uncharacterized protein